MMNSSIEKALKETWEKKDKFYENTKYLGIMEILEKIEGKKFKVSSDKRNQNKGSSDIYVHESIAGEK
jgi:hypothetical protein